MVPRPSLIALAWLGACRSTGKVSVPEDEIRLEPLVCEDPDAREELGPWERRALDVEPSESRELWSGAAAVADLDGDEVLDVVVLTDTGVHLLWGPSLEPEFVMPLERAGAVVAVDLEGDGDRDLYVGTYGGADVLLTNDGSGRFSASEVGPVSHTLNASFSDIDGDGDLDGLALSMGEVSWDPEVPVRHFDPSRPALLWENVAGELSEVGERLPDALHRGFSLAGGLHDLDEDGAVDVYAVNDFGASHGSNLWLRGDGAGGFASREDPHGLDVTTSGMGLALGDVNGDGFEDVAIARWGGIRVFESAEIAGEVAWFQTTSQRIPTEFRASEVAWGGDFADVDNDGDLDLYVSFGYLGFGGRWNNPREQADRLFLDVGEPTWRDVSAEWSVDQGHVTRGTVFADLDGDGWLDLVRPNLDGPEVLYARCGGDLGLIVRLRQDGSNPDAIGARIAIVGTPARRVIRAGGTNYGSAGPPEAHFGLGSTSEVELEVRWPDGDRSRYPGIAGGHRVTIERTTRR